MIRSDFWFGDPESGAARSGLVNRTPDALKQRLKIPKNGDTEELVCAATSVDCNFAKARWQYDEVEAC